MIEISNDSKEIDVTKIVDEIEKTVYDKLKPQGFRKFGRTLHRFVSEDISQVINFQSGSPTGSLRGHMCVNVGIRIPECEEMTFHPETSKKYYSESSCTLRSRLEGEANSSDKTWFDLAKDTKNVTNNIIMQIDDKVIPAFNVMRDREAILEHGKEYPLFDISSYRDRLLKKSMIYGYWGNIGEARALFEAYYQQVLDDDRYKMTNGAIHPHIGYLDELAVELGLR